MKDALQSILKKNGIEEWLIRIKKINGTQGYYILDKKEMLRFQNAVQIEVTVYRTFAEGDDKYRGSMTIAISPSMNEKEIGEKLKFAYDSALSVKNKWYPLSNSASRKRTPLQQSSIFKDGFRNGNGAQWVERIAGDIFNIEHQGVVFNALEVSVSENDHSIVNSDGIDYSWTDYSCFTELVTTTASGEKDEAELFDLFRFSDYSSEQMGRRVKQQVLDTLDRTKAERLSSTGDLPVVLKGKALFEFFSYFINQANARMIFEGMSVFDKGKQLQRGGDLLTIDAVPALWGSDKNNFVDRDGIIPVPVRVLERGKMNSIIADLQFGTYLGEEITGNSRNIHVGPGSFDGDTLKNTPSLETLEFSDFSMNPVTGDFGGEIRLAYFFDGKNTTPVTGGSLTGNINKVIDSIRLSSTIITEGAYEGPVFISMDGVTITG